MKRVYCIVLCLCLMTVLSGCSRGNIRTDSPAETLPPAETAYTAPEGDGEIVDELNGMIYLPSVDGLHLLGRQVRVTPTASESDYAMLMVKALLEAETDGETTKLGGETTLQLYGADPVEVSNGVCTVNLGSSALQMENSELYITGLAIAATLCELDDIQYVNILVADQAAGLDIMNNLAMGSLNAHMGEELTVLWEQTDSKKTPLGEDPANSAYSGVATVYFPLDDGSGIMPETRTLSFQGQSPQIVAQTLLNAMSSGSSYLSGVPDMPELSSLQSHTPLVSELDDGGRLITLSFNADLEERLGAAGIDTGCMIAAVVYTLTTYIPGVTAVSIRIGDNLLTSLYHREFGSVLFPGGIQKRNQFSDYLVTRKTLMLTDGSELVPTARALPRQNAGSPRTVFQALMKGPTEKETGEGLGPTLPAGLTDEDILGISVDGDTMLINLSGEFARKIIEFGPENEQRVCYSIVNTLCRNSGTKYVYFFFDGEQRESLCGVLYWSGQFISNPGMNAENAG